MTDPANYSCYQNDEGETAMGLGNANHGNSARPVSGIELVFGNDTGIDSHCVEKDTDCEDWRDNNKGFGSN